MKPIHYGIVAIAGLGIIAAFGAKKVSDNRAEKLSSSITIAKAETASAATADGRAKAAATPEIYFLNEKEELTESQRLFANKFPKVTGNKKIYNSKAVTSREDGEFISPRWSPDGLELLLSGPGYSGLYSVGINGGEITRISGKEHIGFGAKWDENGEIQTVTNDGKKQAFNPDGTPVDSASDINDSSRIGAFTKDDNVYVRANPGEAAVPVGSGNDRYYGGELSPDGKYVSYNGLETGLYIQPVDGSAPPIHLGVGDNPQWLPDSSGIVFSASLDDGHNVIASDIYYADVNGGNVSNLTNNPGAINRHPSVGPDGTTIAYETDGVINVGSIQ